MIPKFGPLSKKKKIIFPLYVVGLQGDPKKEFIFRVF